MRNIKVGDLIRIKDRPDWPTPPGYPLRNSKGEVIELKKKEGFVTLRLLKTKSNIPRDALLTLRLENLEREKIN